MKKKTILISGIVIILVAIGVFILLRKPIFIPVEEEAIPSPEAEAPVEIPEEEPAEIAGLSSCVILDEEYCKKGELLYPPEDREDIKDLLVGFNLPAGTKIYSPFDGALKITTATLEEGQVSKTIDLLMWPIEEVRREFSFQDITPNPILEKALKEGGKGIIEIKWGETSEGPVIEKMLQVKKGQFVGETTDYISLSFWGKKYNFVVFTLNTRDLPPYTPETFPQVYIDIDFLQQYFPYIKEKE